ncbi:hypothetical protein [Lactobacillus sp. ESL0681]|uniref:hypothetical protein n=1 Tax=Lactobacillus sp. ESL0681 TaxID=2983211 RepID=UPI0023F6CB64|nr:hypothetical protein [Lactobacillus sp. ESL0681]WEV40102.1 hypothetical protein OZX59_07800 [Lactobacillus sp. ESL0681]
MGKNMVITQFFVNMRDTQPDHQVVNHDVVELIKPLYKSVARYDTELTILGNFVKLAEKWPLLNVVQVDPHNYLSDNMYFLRWEVTYEYLLHHPEIDQAALVDAGDVELLNYPFTNLQDDILYIGDEYNYLDDPIVKNDLKPSYLNDFVERNQYLQLLNPGVIVGSRKILLEFLEIVIKLLTDDLVASKFTANQEHLGSFDMGLINFVTYNYFNERLCHGRKVTTRFRNEEHAVKSWFRHK